MPVCKLPCLSVTTIRSAEFDAAQKITTLIVNSLLETNLGAVPIYCIYVLMSSRFTEGLKRRDKIGFTARLAELNGIRIIERMTVRKAAEAVENADDEAEVRSDGGSSAKEK